MIKSPLGLQRGLTGQELFRLGSAAVVSHPGTGKVQLKISGKFAGSSIAAVRSEVSLRSGPGLGMDVC